MVNFSKYLFLTAVGGCIYYCIELVFRGFSHWSMFLLGGICFLFMYIQGTLTRWKDSIFRQVVRCTIFVASLEFITGIIVNKWFCWNVWDYSDMPFQIFGQICLPFTLLFSFLCCLGVVMSGHLAHWVYKEEKPHYHIL